MVVIRVKMSPYRVIIIMCFDVNTNNKILLDVANGVSINSYFSNFYNESNLSNISNSIYHVKEKILSEKKYIQYLADLLPEKISREIHISNIMRTLGVLGGEEKLSEIIINKIINKNKYCFIIR